MAQSLIATLIVLTAAAWLLRRMFLTVRAAIQGGIGPGSSCGSCSRNPAHGGPAMVQLGVRRTNSSNRSQSS